MKTTKTKSIAYVCIAIIGTVVIIFTVNTIDVRDSITEKNVRSQLEEMYDAEVAEVKKNEDVYEAIIAKSGEVYLVEMNANTGDVNSLEHTNQFIIEEVSTTSKELTNENKNSEVSQKITNKKSAENIGVTKKKSSNVTPKAVVKEKTEKSPTKVKVVENSKGTENTSKKQSSSKNEEKVEEKPIKETIKSAIKDVLKKEESKTEASSKEKKKVEEVKKEQTTKVEDTKATIQSETIKVEPEKAAVLAAEPITVEAVENLKPDEPQTTSLQTEEKSGEIEKNTTVLITAEEALKLTLAHQKGLVVSNTFVRTDEGGYYLIVMEATPKESSKEKKSKATVQVHAISGKILSVTWE